MFCKTIGCSNPIKFRGLCKQCYYKEYEKKPHRVAYNKSEKRLEAGRLYGKRRSKTEAFKISMKKYQKTDKFKAVINKYQKTLKAKFKEGVRQAKRRNQSWTIAFEQYLILVEPNKCHYCPNPLNSLGHSLDRKNNDIGYEFDNVVPCCKDCNRTKGDRLTYDEMIAVAKLLTTMRGL